MTAQAPEIDPSIVVEIQKQKIANLEWQLTLLQAQLYQLTAQQQDAQGKSDPGVAE